MTPEQLAMLGAIIEQRKKSYTDIFELDLNATLDYLNAIDAHLKLKLNLAKQSATLEQLIEQLKMIRIDYVVDTVYDGEFKACQPKWKYGTEWAYNEIQIGGRVPIEDCRGKMFVNMTLDEADALDSTYIKKHPAKLVFDKDFQYYYVKMLDGSRDEYHFPPLTPGTPRHRVIMYAAKRAGKTIHKRFLVKDGIIPDNKALKTQIFDKNKSLTEVLRPFITLTRDTIRIKLSTELTTLELETIRKATN